VSVKFYDNMKRTIQITGNDVVAGLQELGLAAGDVVLVHSSLSAFGYVEGGADTVIDALLKTIGPTGTLVMPTFTWGEFHDQTGGVFDVRNTPCETGCIPETLRQRPEALRSSHICHSMTAQGPRAHEVLGEDVSSFGKGSAFDHLYRMNAWNLLLGVSFSSCTALHSAEERVQVPYRAYRNFKHSTIILVDGQRVPAKAIEYLRQDGASNDFAKLGELFEAAGILHTCTIGKAICINARIRDIIDRAEKLLRQDPYFLSRPAAARS